MTTPAVRVRDLVKVYPTPDGGELRAVDGLDLDVRSGEVLAVLGPNGAGKTTTMEMIEGLTEPTSGHVEVLGMDVRTDLPRVKQRIGVQLQASSYFPHLRLHEILALFGSFHEVRVDPDELLDRVGLGDRRRALVGELSGGQAQRFSIVASLVNDPEVVFLDEPTTGLDPQARRALWDLIRDIRDGGRTIVLTTHYMEEAEALADRVAIVDRGRLVDLDTPRALVASLPSSHRLSFRLPRPADAADLARIAGVATVTPHLNGHAEYELAVTSPELAVPGLFAWAGDAGASPTELRLETPGLEDVFLARTGTRLRD